MYFDPGFISTDGQTDYKFSPLNQIGPIDESSFMRFEDYDLSNLCPICEGDGQKVFCNLNNEYSESLLRFKQKAGINVPDLRGEYFHFMPDYFLENHVFCLFF